MKNPKQKYPELISVIPFSIRNKYIKNLEIKENYLKSTKYFIAHEINKIVNDGDFTKWDEEILMGKLKISNGALRFHKSIILKELRTLTFRISDEKDEESINSKFNRFAEYYYEGSMEKYRMQFILFEKELTSLVSSYKKYEYAAILSEIQRMLMISYFHKRNYVRFNYFTGKITNIRKNKNLNAKLKERDKSLIEINYLWTCYYKDRFNWKNDNNFRQTEIISSKVYALAKKNNFIIHYFSSIVVKMWTAQNNGDISKMKYMAEKGYSEAIVNNEEVISLLFKANIIYTELHYKKITAAKATEKIRDLYERSRGKLPYSNITIYLLDLYVQTVFLVDEVKATQLLKEQVNIKMIVGHNYDAIYNRFFYHFYDSFSRIVEYETTYDKNNDQKYIYIKSVNLSLLSEVEENIKQLLNYEKKLFSIKFLSDIYIVQGMIDLFKGNSIDIEKAILIQQRNDRLRKTRKFISKDWYFNTLRIYFKIIRLGKFKKEIIKRDDLIHQFIKQVEYFYTYPDDLGKLEYNILVYASQNINSDKLTNEIIKFYQFAINIKKLSFV